jgi:Fe-Mn family superoxide dismutase
MNTIQNFETLLGTSGFSDALLKNHFALYEGYVKNTNLLSDKLAALAKSGGFGTPEFNELKRRFGWEYNGMRLHELYFGNMKNGGVTLELESALARALEDQFGSFDAWLADFKATGALRGIGWTMLVREHTGTLTNIWINEHDVGLLVDATPLLVMDVFEHSFMLDYGLKRADYIAAFMQAVDWKVVQQRFGEN